MECVWSNYPVKIATISVWIITLQCDGSSTSQVSLKSDKNNAILFEDLCTFMISLWIILRMRNISDKICKENQNTFYIQ